MPDNPAPLPDFTRWPSFPFEGDMRVKALAPPVAVEPPRSGEDASECVACNTPDDSYIWVNERWRVRAMDRPTGLPMVLILECRSHLDMGDLPNLLAAELGVMTVRLERAIRSLDGVARVHVNRWGDGSAHLHMWFLARPYGRLQLRGTFLSLWDDILPTIPEDQWRENLALVAAWLAGFGGQTNAEPAHIQWQSPSTFSLSPTAAAGPGTEYGTASAAPATTTETAGGDSEAEFAPGNASVPRDSETKTDAGTTASSGDLDTGGTLNGGESRAKSTDAGDGGWEDGESSAAGAEVGEGGRDGSESRTTDVDASDEGWEGRESRTGSADAGDGGSDDGESRAESANVGSGGRESGAAAAGRTPYGGTVAAAGERVQVWSAPGERDVPAASSKSVTTAGGSSEVADGPESTGDAASVDEDLAVGDRVESDQDAPEGSRANGAADTEIVDVNATTGRPSADGGDTDTAGSRSGADAGESLEVSGEGSAAPRTAIPRQSTQGSDRGAAETGDVDSAGARSGAPAWP